MQGKQVLNLHHSGWIDITGKIGDDGLVFAKMVIQRDVVSIKFKLSVHCNFSWTVDYNSTTFSVQSALFSSMPSSLRSVQDVLSVINFLDSLSPCCGNNDKKFLPMVESRKGLFMQG